MEQNNADSLFGLQVDQASAGYFREGTRWARFISIIYFIGIAICGVAFAFAGSAMAESLAAVIPGLHLIGGFLAVIITVALMVGLLTGIMLFRFGSLTVEGIQRNDQSRFNEGLKSLKYYFIISGVIATLQLGLAIIGLITELTREPYLNY